MAALQSRELAAVWWDKRRWVRTNQALCDEKLLTSTNSKLCCAKLFLFILTKIWKAPFSISDFDLLCKFHSWSKISLSQTGQTLNTNVEIYEIYSYSRIWWLKNSPKYLFASDCLEIHRGRDTNVCTNSRRQCNHKACCIVSRRIDSHFFLTLLTIAKTLQLHVKLGFLKLF